MTEAKAAQTPDIGLPCTEAELTALRERQRVAEGVLSESPYGLADIGKIPDADLQELCAEISRRLKTGPTEIKPE